MAIQMICCDCQVAKFQWRWQISISRPFTHFSHLTCNVSATLSSPLAGARLPVETFDSDLLRVLPLRQMLTDKAPLPSDEKVFRSSAVEVNWKHKRFNYNAYLRCCQGYAKCFLSFSHSSIHSLGEWDCSQYFDVKRLSWILSSRSKLFDFKYFSLFFTL